MRPIDKSYSLCSREKSSENKKRPIDKKKISYDHVVTPAEAVPPETSTSFMDEMLQHFRMINDRFDHIGVSTKEHTTLTVNDKVFADAQ